MLAAARDRKRRGSSARGLRQRFSVFAEGVDSALVGTSSERHLRAAVEAMRLGALPPDEVDAIRRAFDEHGREWQGLT